MAMLRRRFCPPEMPLRKMVPTEVSAHEERPENPIKARYKTFTGSNNSL
jgi:hypothetical protein